MRQFKVFTHMAGEIQAIKVGFCWPAFLFGGFWAMFAKLWVIGIAALIAGIALHIESKYSQLPGIRILLNFASFYINLVLGLKGNKWRESNLVARGFEFQNTVSAANKNGAVDLFLNNRVEK
jgi:hypothetical protein